MVLFYSRNRLGCRSAMPIFIGPQRIGRHRTPGNPRLFLINPNITIMKNLTKTSFFMRLKECIENSSEVSADDLLNCYDEFLENLTALSKTQTPVTDVIRCLKNTQQEFAAWHEIAKSNGSKKDTPVLPCLIKAISVLQTELEIVDLCIRYPHINKDITSIASPLYWSKEYTQTDLIELITAIHSLGVLRVMDGSPAGINTITSVFENMFNIKLLNTEQKRWLAKNRKLKLTRFLDILKGAMVELSMK